jgi:hypothetical protein
VHFTIDEDEKAEVAHQTKIPWHYFFVSLVLSLHIDLHTLLNLRTVKTMMVC